MSTEHATPSKPQLALLAEIAVTEAGVLYVGRYMRYARTIQALANRGLVYKSEPDYSSFAHDGWSVTDAGRAVLARRAVSREGQA